MLQSADGTVACCRLNKRGLAPADALLRKGRGQHNPAIIFNRQEMDWLLGLSLLFGLCGQMKSSSHVQRLCERKIWNFLRV